MSPQLPRPRRAVGTPLAAVLAAAFTLTLSGCHVPGTQKTLPSKQLKQELLTAPVGSKPYSSGTLAPGGILTLDQYVDGVFSHKDQAEEKRDARNQGMDYAVQTNWHATDGSSVDLYLIQFRTSAGAQDFVSGVSEGTSSEETPTEPLFALKGVPGGEAWKAGAVDSVGDIQQIAWYAVGNVVVDLHYYTPAAARTAELDKLAVAQRARVVGSVRTPSPLPQPTETAPPAPSSKAATATAADRKRLLSDLVTLPHGARAWPQNKDNGVTGVMDLKQLLVRFADPSDKQQITSEEQDRGFQYAVRRNWTAKDSSQADIYLLQFATATGAQSFTLGYQGSAADTVGASDTFTIPHSGDAKGYEHSKLTSDGFRWTETYAVVGNVALDIDFWVPAKTRRADVIALAEKQYAKLMADPTLAAAAAAAPALPTADS